MAATLPRTIGFRTALSLVVGTIIGSAIFMRPVEIAQLLGDPIMVILAWIVGGVFSLLMLMVLAEVAALMPEEGGLYAITRNIYGDFWGYLFGWAYFLVVNCAGTAGISFVFSEYLGFFIDYPAIDAQTVKSFAITIPMLGTVFPLDAAGEKGVAIILVTAFTCIGYRSTKAGGNLAVLFTIAKLLAITILLSGFMIGSVGSAQHLVQASSSIHPTGLVLVLSIAAAVNGTLSTYDGAQNMLYMTGEIRNPGRNIPWSLILGIFICMGVYLAVNVGLIYVLGIDGMANSKMVASDAAVASFGQAGGALVAVFICISVIGTVNSCVLSQTRLTYGMAKDGLFLRSLARIHPRFSTPANAFLLHWVFMVLFVLTGSFYMLTDMYIFIVWFFNLFLVGGLFILRRRMPQAERPYKVWGYPWMPALVFAGSSLYLLTVLYSDITNYLDGKAAVVNSLSALVLTVTGIPLYYFFRTKKDPQS